MTTLTEKLAMFTGPLVVIVGLVLLTPLGSLFNDKSAVAAVVFTCAVLGLQFIIVRHSSHGNVRTTQELHIRRKIQHAGSGILVVFGSFFANNIQVSIVLACSSAVFYLITNLRKRYKVVNETYLHVFGPILRQHEIAYRLPGAFWFLLGCSISFVIYSKTVARLSILHLSLGDPCASFFGITLGQNSTRLSNGKTFAGIIGCFIVCFLSSALFLTTVGDDTIDQLSLVLKCIVMLLCGVCGTVGEALYVGCDDNLSLPIISGLGMSVLWYLL